VDLLSQSDGLPQIEDPLVEDPSLGKGCSKWSYDGVSQRSINNNLFDINSNQYAYDFDGILIPFWLLHNVPKATIFVPEDIDREGEGLMLKIIERVMELQGPFDSDNITQKNLHRTYVSFEDSLDMFQGRTAGMLRLHRFSIWYKPDGRSPYLEEMERISFNVKVKQHNLNLRYILMLGFYPLSTVMQRIRQQLDLPPSLRPPTFTLENRWDESEFHRYYGLANAPDIGGHELEEIQ
jgi:hypothetical protein